jgi:hypothetical protein
LHPSQAQMLYLLARKLERNLSGGSGSSAHAAYCCLDLIIRDASLAHQVAEGTGIECD